MVERKYELIGGILIAIFITVSTTYYIQETGKYKTCYGGWILIESGPNEGMYECPTRVIEPQWCHHGSDEGPKNIGYRCYLGIPIQPSEYDITPVIDTKAGLCFNYKIDGEVFKHCPNYPEDLTNKCKYDRYGRAFKCENVLQQEIEKDMDNFFTETLSREKYAQGKKLTDITITSGDTTVKNLIGCDYNLDDKQLVC